MRGRPCLRGIWGGGLMGDGFCWVLHICICGNEYAFRTPSSVSPHVCSLQPLRRLKQFWKDGSPSPWNSMFQAMFQAVSWNASSVRLYNCFVASWFHSCLCLPFVTYQFLFSGLLYRSTCFQPPGVCRYFFQWEIGTRVTDVPGIQAVFIFPISLAALSGFGTG